MSHLAASAAIRRKLHQFRLPLGKGDDRVSTGLKTADAGSFTLAAYGLAATVVLPLLKVLLSPATEGPYSVARGPVTAFEAALAADHPRISVVQKHFHSFRNHPALPRVSSSAHHQESGATRGREVDQSSALFTCRGTALPGILDLTRR